MGQGPVVGQEEQPLRVLVQPPHGEEVFPPQVLGQVGHLARHPDLAVVDAPPVDMPAGIAQQEHAGRETSHDGYEQHPERGLFVRQHRTDAVLGILLPEGQGDGLGEAGLVA